MWVVVTDTMGVRMGVLMIHWVPLRRIGIVSHFSSQHCIVSLRWAVCILYRAIWEGPIVVYLSGVDDERAIFSAGLAMADFLRLNRGTAFRVRPGRESCIGNLICFRFLLLGGIPRWRIRSWRRLIRRAIWMVMLLNEWRNTLIFRPGPPIHRSCYAVRLSLLGWVSSEKSGMGSGNGLRTQFFCQGSRFVSILKIGCFSFIEVSLLLYNSACFCCWRCRRWSGIIRSALSLVDW